MFAGMARKLRLEYEGAVYHVIARGNYRADVFGEERTKAAFLKCLGQACEKSGWVVHAWCVMSNHYHLCLETPQPNLVEGMRWLQATFCLRFNRFLQESGHVFQGRYKALPVDSGAEGAVVHYIHLNPIRAGVVNIEQLAKWPWTSLSAYVEAQARPVWLSVEAALAHAGGLPDTPAGRRSYLSYLGWLQEDDAAKKALGFERMSKDWAVGARGFKMELLQTHKHLEASLERGEAGTRQLLEELWEERLSRYLHAVGKTDRDARVDAKGAAWKVAVASAMKSTTTANNPWLARRLNIGSPFRLCRLASACASNPMAFEPFASRTAKCKG
jgi:REP element-mobilizing transposase RayT